jgi:hypothetical protein
LGVKRHADSQQTIQGSSVLRIGAQQQKSCNGQFRTPRRVIAAMVELDKRYAGNVGDVLFKWLGRWL